MNYLKELENLNSELCVNMGNALIRAAHGLKIMEKRLLMLAVSKLDSAKPPTPQNMVVRIKVSEFTDEYGLTSKTLYGEAKAATETLMNRYIRFKHGKAETRLQWVGRSTYYEGEGAIEIAFWHELGPLLFELEKEFTSYKLSRAGVLRSKYAWRLFELLMQFKKTGYLKIKINEFNHAMESPDSLTKNFSNLRKKCIEPAVKEIREKDGLKLRWAPIKTGRKVTALEFYFPVEQQLTLSIDEQIKQYVNTNPQKTTGKKKPEIIQMMKEESQKTKSV